jgi:hypothetical protein
MKSKFRPTQQRKKLRTSEISGKGKSTMKTDFLNIIPSILFLTIVLIGCGSVSTLAPTSVPVEAFTAESIPTDTLETSSTLDPCAPGQIEVIIQKVHSHMREFDDASYLASALPKAQRGDSIADLQRIRREAEDEEVPACLTPLKDSQIQHMNAAINTFIAVMRLSSEAAIDCASTQITPEQQSICQNVALTSQLHDQYFLELARLLGLTLVPSTPVPPGTPETPTP